MFSCRWLRPFPMFWLTFVLIRHNNDFVWLIPVVGMVLALYGIVWATKTPRASASKAEIAYLGPVALTAGARCLVCRHSLSGEVIYCGRCHTPHHRACFTYVGGCSLYACAGRKAA